MNERDAKKQIQALRAFHTHLRVFAVFISALAVVNFMTYLRGATEVWVIYPFVWWGAAVALQGIAAYRGMGRKQWEAEKFRELTGWKSSEEELARLVQRIDTLLAILSADDGEELGPTLKAAEANLRDARRAVEHYRAPFDGSNETDLTLQDVTSLVERLETILTRRDFERFQKAKFASRAERSATGS
jgi:2TM domain